MIDLTFIYVLFGVLFVIILLMILWLAILTRGFWVSNSAMDQDLTDLESSVREHNRKFIKIEGSSATEVGMSAVAAAESALAVAQASQIIVRRRDEEGDDVVYPTDR